MPKSRVLRFTGATLTVPTSRVLRVTGAGVAAAAPRSRVVRVTGAGVVSVVVNPLPSLTGIEPESTIAVTATLNGGGAADSWAWRLITGPATTIVGTGNTVAITAPSHINGASITIGVRATKDGTTSTEVVFAVTVLPQTEWWWTGTGWIPHVEEWEPAGFGMEPFGLGYFGGA